jgi:hypothetical protein
MLAAHCMAIARKAVVESGEDAEHIPRRLSAQDRRYSVGLMQITSTNFRHYGVSATELLDPCTNLSVFEHILRDCYRRGGTLKDLSSRVPGTA